MFFVGLGNLDLVIISFIFLEVFSIVAFLSKDVATVAEGTLIFEIGFLEALITVFLTAFFLVLGFTLEIFFLVVVFTLFFAVTFPSCVTVRTKEPLGNLLQLPRLSSGAADNRIVSPGTAWDGAARFRRTGFRARVLIVGGLAIHAE